MPSHTFVSTANALGAAWRKKSFLRMRSRPDTTKHRRNADRSGDRRTSTRVVPWSTAAGVGLAKRTPLAGAGWVSTICLAVEDAAQGVRPSTLPTGVHRGTTLVNIGCFSFHGNQTMGGGGRKAARRLDQRCSCQSEIRAEIIREKGTNREPASVVNDKYNRRIGLAWTSDLKAKQKICNKLKRPSQTEWMR